MPISEYHIKLALLIILLAILVYALNGCKLYENMAGGSNPSPSPSAMPDPIQLLNLNSFELAAVGNYDAKATKLMFTDNGIADVKSIDKRMIEMPKGTIIMWSGEGISTIPTGWKICDGNNGEVVNGIEIPDLRGRFILMVNPESNPTQETEDGEMFGNKFRTTSIGDMGGVQRSVLQLPHMPRHYHINDLYSRRAEKGGTGHSIPFTSLIYKDSSLLYTDGTGGKQPMGLEPGGLKAEDEYINHDRYHNNIPPYYAIAYIIKVI